MVCVWTLLSLAYCSSLMLVFSSREESAVVHTALVMLELLILIKASLVMDKLLVHCIRVSLKLDDVELQVVIMWLVYHRIIMVRSLWNVRLRTIPSAC